MFKGKGSISGTPRTLTMDEISTGLCIVRRGEQNQAKSEAKCGAIPYEVGFGFSKGEVSFNVILGMRE